MLSRVVWACLFYVNFLLLVGNVWSIVGDKRKCAPKENIEEYVNILGGTDSRYDLSRGSTLPFITRPWGFNNYAPQTDDDPTWQGWWFHPSDRRFFGIRVTHQPSPWISDYGNFLLQAYMPTNPGDASASQDRSAAYSAKKSAFHPYYFSTSLMNYANTNGMTQLELTPTQHGGLMRVNFPAYVEHESGDGTSTNFVQTRRIAIRLFATAGDSIQVTNGGTAGTTTISGYTHTNSGGIDAGSNFAHYFYAEIYAGEGGTTPTTSSHTYSDTHSLGYVDLDPQNPDTQIVTVRFATSLISLAQAQENFRQEVGVDKTFEAVKAEAVEDWRGVLNRAHVVSIDDSYDACEQEDLKTVFYSSLFRASLFPRQLVEITQEGEGVHWSPYNYMQAKGQGNGSKMKGGVEGTRRGQNVYSGLLSTDSGFWDAWNTIYPLLTLINRPMLGTTIQGWLSAYQEGGWLPKWASPGYRGSMVGTMGDVSLADAIVNSVAQGEGIGGFDVPLAYQAIRQDAFQVPPQGVEGVGRVCLPDYLTYGYIPRGGVCTTGGECGEITSRTLNYYQSDYAIAKAATAMNMVSDARELSVRAYNYSSIFNPDGGFFRSREKGSGAWVEPFDQYAWGGDYTEGGPWQFRFYVPFDAEGLSKVYKDAGLDMCAKLKDAVEVGVESDGSGAGVVHTGGYGSVIHEMTELLDHGRGQYAHNNQPVHHMLYMHMVDGFAGACSTQGHKYIKQTLQEQYRADADMFPGDEDNGEMGGWFVLSSLGLYNVNPGGGAYTLGVPLFSEVEVDISDTVHSKYLEKVWASTKHGVKAKGGKGVKEEKKTLRIVAKNNSKHAYKVSRITFNDVELPASSNTIPYSMLAGGGTLVFEFEA